jgi:hypothetical protein
MARPALPPAIDMSSAKALLAALVAAFRTITASRSRSRRRRLGLARLARLSDGSPSTTCRSTSSRLVEGSFASHWRQA